MAARSRESAPSWRRRCRNCTSVATRVPVSDRRPVSQPWMVFLSTPSCSASASCVRPADSRMSLSRKPVMRPSHGRPVGRNPPLVRVAPEGAASEEAGSALSAAICLFLALLSGQPELVPPVSGTANLLILTSHYDGPTQPNRAVERRQHEAPDRHVGDRLLVRDAAGAGGGLRDPPAQGRRER